MPPLTIIHFLFQQVSVYSLCFNKLCDNDNNDVNDISHVTNIHVSIHVTLIMIVMISMI